MYYILHWPSERIHCWLSLRRLNIKKVPYLFSKGHGVVYHYSLIFPLHFNNNLLIIFRFDLWCLTPLQQCFNYINFIGGGNKSTRRKPPTCRKSPTNEPTTLVVICTNYIGSYKSNYHIITTTTDPKVYMCFNIIKLSYVVSTFILHFK